MFKNLLIALKHSPGRIVILLLVAGLAYWLWPRTAASTAPWRPSLNSPATAEAPADTAPASDEASRPAAENAINVAAQASTATATATATPVSTATPVPQKGGTPTRPTPTNQATAAYLDALATADALLNSTATPTPTPAMPTATGTPTPSPTSIAFVVVTKTPTPQNIITVAAQAARATAVATAIGTYTPMPWNWVVPIVVTPTPPPPTPANAATATFQAAEATAAAFVYGTPTPMPINVWTATPTPFMRPVSGEVATPWIPPTPTPLPTPTPTPLPIPQELVGKILFLSNRSGGPQPLSQPLVYVIDPDGSNLAVLTDVTFYNTALARDTYSADQRYRAFVREVGRGEDEVPIIFSYDYHYAVEEQVTFFKNGVAWGPVWSPTQEQIAFVSNVSGSDEIWTIHRDGSDARQLTDGAGSWHPSWSPDGSKIVFWSNRYAHRQILVMDADGSNAYSLSTTEYHDWNPIWVKYTDPAREPVLGIGELP